MKITDIHVDGFGVWNTLSVDDLPQGITLFYGPNEAGKTTLMQFLRAVFYGFSPERRRLYLPPVFGGVPGGMLRIENHSGQFVVERREADNEAGGDGRAIVLAANGSRQGQHLLNVLLAGVDESVFNNVFAIGIRELQELATLNDTQAAEQLYNLASGVDRVSLVEVMRHLDTSRTQIWDSDSQNGSLAELLAAREKLAAEIDQLQHETQRWSDLAQQRRTVADEVAKLEDSISCLKLEARTVEIALRARQPWQARQELRRRRSEIGNVEPLPENAVGRLDELNQKIDRQREQLKPLRGRWHQLRRQLAAQPINRALWSQSARIEAICEHGPWIASLDQDARQLQEEVEKAEQALDRHAQSLPVVGQHALGTATVVTAGIVDQLQPAALALREAGRKRVLARKLQKKNRQEVDQTSKELEQELVGRRYESFDDAIEQVGTLVKQLRHRIHLDEQSTVLRREQDEQVEHYSECLDRQFQRIRILAAIGGMFVFGFVLALTGLFGWKVIPMSAEVCWGVSLLGLVSVGLSVAWKSVVERTTHQELEESLRRQEGLRDELLLLATQREEVDRALPPGRGPLSTRLAAAEKELHELEELVPLQQERARAHQQRRDSRRHTVGAEDEFRDARRRWRRALRNAGLPETLTARQVRQLAAHHQKRAALESQLAERRGRLEKLTADRSAFVERLEKLSTEVGLGAVNSDPQIKLSQLATALAGQRDMSQQRREWQQQARLARRDLSRGLEQLRRLGRTRESLLAESRVADEEALRERAGRLEEYQNLEKQLRTLAAQMKTVIGDHSSEQEIAGQLEAHNHEELKQRSGRLATRLENCHARLAQLHQRHGEMKQEMKALAEDRRLAVARLEFARTETQIEEVTRRWATLAVTLRLLEEIRETYEAERQPETLGEASLYLERLTAGKYVRVWTPLGKNELRVDDHSGKPMPLDPLSRGTREAVFLSLRLALVAAYGRRGVNLPMILDDVLVNLDATRSEAAVALLEDFAREGRQLLFFTCHDHIRSLFQKAGTDIRILPAHGTPGVHVPVSQPSQPVSQPSQPVSQPSPPVGQPSRPTPTSPEPQPTANQPAGETAATDAALIQHETAAPIAEPPHPPIAEDQPADDASSDDEVLDTQPSDELNDDDAFSDGIWWWDSQERRVEEEETAA